MVLTHEIANYPGVESISGYQLSGIMKKQAKTFGCDLKTNVSLAAMNIDDEVKYISLDDGSSFTSEAVILATGGRPRTLGVPGENEYRGKGISYCATCDGDFFTGKEIIVVGGGNSALEEAVSLTKYASKVTIIHQFDNFQAFEHAVQEAKNNNRINFFMESAVTSFYGNEKLESVDVKNLATGETKNMKTDGAFIFIGYVPNTEFVKETIRLNQRGEIIVNSDMQTNVQGVFAAGDSIVKRFRQVTTAVGDGTIAALSASEYINSRKVKQKQKSND